MLTLDEPARVSLVAGSSSGSCDLCMAEAAIPSTTVVIKRPRGGIVQWAACDWCVQALRRISAATGGRAAFVSSGAAGVPASASSGQAGHQVQLVGPS